MQAKIFNADCFDILPTLRDGSVDMVFTDLPYGTTACAWDTVIDLERMWKELYRVTKPTAAIVMTCVQPFTITLGASNIKHLKYDWVWVKSRATNHMNAKFMPMKKSETVLVFARKRPTYNPQGLVEVNRKVKHNDQRKKGATFSGGIPSGEYTQQYVGYPHNVLHFPGVGKPVHPTEKPVDLIKYMIHTYTNPGETVLDICAGSGTTGLAAQEAGRNCVLIEKEKKFYDICVQRMEKYGTGIETQGQWTSRETPSELLERVLPGTDGSSSR